MATVQTSLANSIDAAGDTAQMDVSAKGMLKHRSVLAVILKECTEEFKDYSLEYIEQNCFVGEVNVSKVVVDQNGVDTDSTIVGSNTEDTTNSEGTIHYDIVFDAAVPRSTKIVRMVINLEIQVNTNLSYAVVTRGVYYGARLISRQKGSVFTHMNYENIQKVYSIWICPDAKGESANSIAKYGITQQEVYGTVNEPVENYDKLCVIVINLNDEGMKSEKEIIGFLSTLLSTSISVKEKKAKLAHDYHFEMTKEIEEEADNMCNIGTATLMKGRVEGEQKKAIETAINLIKMDLLTLEQIASATGLSLGAVQGLAEEVRKN
jgi:hypothetical protein